jgi:hypothetical protein
MEARQAMTHGRGYDRRLSEAVACALRGDRDAVRYLYCRFADEVFDSLRSVVDEPRAEEITRSLFASLPESLAEFDARRDWPFRGWLLGHALAVAVDLRGSAPA